MWNLGEKWLSKQQAGTPSLGQKSVQEVLHRKEGRKEGKGFERRESISCKEVVAKAAGDPHELP